MKEVDEEKVERKRPQIFDSGEDVKLITVFCFEGNVEDFLRRGGSVSKRCTEGFRRRPQDARGKARGGRYHA